MHPAAVDDGTECGIGNGIDLGESCAAPGLLFCLTHNMPHPPYFSEGGAGQELPGAHFLAGCVAAEKELSRRKSRWRKHRRTEPVWVEG